MRRLLFVFLCKLLFYGLICQELIISRYPVDYAIRYCERVIALQDVDFNVRNVASFAVMKDALTN